MLTKEEKFIQQIFLFEEHKFKGYVYFKTFKPVI